MSHLAPNEYPRSSSRGELLRAKPYQPSSSLPDGRTAHAVLDLSILALVWLGLLHLQSAGVALTASTDEYVGSLLIYAALTVLSFAAQQLYSRRKRWSVGSEALAILAGTTFATVLLSAFLLLSRSSVPSGKALVLNYGLSTAGLLVWREAKRRLTKRRATKGNSPHNALILGASEVGQTLAREFEQNKHLGYSVVGFLDENHISDTNILGKFEDFSWVVQSRFVDHVFVTTPSPHDFVQRITSEAARLGISIHLIPEFYERLAQRAEIEYVGHFPVLNLHRPTPRFGLFIKRALDIVGSLFGLLLSAPLMFICAASIKLDSAGPILYRSNRIGKKGRMFICYKLRTMATDADELKESLRPQNERNGPFFKISNDPRLTRVGGFLRKYSLDEIPQLWNVLKGDMSLVGPRPHPLDDCQKYALHHLRRLMVKPGLTGLWQVTARQDPSFEKNMALDLEYIDRWNLWEDVEILLRTVPTVLKGTGQ